MVLRIKDLSGKACDYTCRVPAGMTPNQVVEKWGKAWASISPSGRVPSCQWQVSDGNDVVSAMIDDARKAI
jgi:hypothetical protein